MVYMHLVQFVARPSLVESSCIDRLVERCKARRCYLPIVKTPRSILSRCIQFECTLKWLVR